MKLRNKFVFLATLLAAHAAAADDGFHMRAGVGTSHFDELGIDDRDTEKQLAFGYRWSWFGVEAGRVDIGDFRGSGLAVAADLDGWHLGVTAKLPIAEQWFFGARAGAWHWDAGLDHRFPMSGSSDTFYYESSGTEGYAGVSVGYDIDERWSVSANYDYYDFAQTPLESHVDVVGVVAEVRF